MISATGAPLGSSAIVAARAAPCQGSSSKEPGLAARPPEADEVSLAPPDSRAAGDGFYERTSLAIRSHSRVVATDDGQLRVSSHSRLRFRYDFETADGTRIHVRAKVNLDYSQTDHGDGETQSIRLRAKVGVSVFQQDVSAAVQPVLDAPHVSADARSGISHALDLFHRATDALGSRFLDEHQVDGDGLIAGLVEEFNGLSESLSSMLFSTPAGEEAASSGEAVEPLELPASDPSEVLRAEPQQEAPPQTIDPASGPVSESLENVVRGGSPAPEGVSLAEAGEQEGPDDGGRAGPATGAEPQPLFRSVMFRMRLQAIQSLTSLVGAFDSDAPSMTVSQTIARTSVQLAARYHSSAPGALLAHDGGIDTQV